MTAFAVVAARGCNRDEAEGCVIRFFSAIISQLPRRKDMPIKPTASKEEAQNALADLRLLRSQLSEEEQAKQQDKLDRLDAFLERAYSRLPSKKAIDKDRDRKKNYSKNRKLNRKKATAGA